MPGEFLNNIHIQQMRDPTVAEVEVEIVERKGLGHPDAICNAVMKRISQTLSHVYWERFAAILHHHCDKGLLVADRVDPDHHLRYQAGFRYGIGIRGQRLEGLQRMT